MIIEKGEKVHIITRRHFENDVRRHFAGEVLEVEGTQARLEGYTFIFDASKNEYTRKVAKRIRIYDLTQSAYIVCIIPGEVVLGDLCYKLSEEKTLVCTDGKSFQLDVSEFGAKR